MVDNEKKKEKIMKVTLADLKGVEVRLRDSAKRERIGVFRRDIKYAYRLTKARRRLAERRVGIGSE